MEGWKGQPLAAWGRGVQQHASDTGEHLNQPGTPCHPVSITRSEASSGSQASCHIAIFCLFPFASASAPQARGGDFPPLGLPHIPWYPQQAGPSAAKLTNPVHLQANEGETRARLSPLENRTTEQRPKAAPSDTPPPLPSPPEPGKGTGGSCTRVHGHTPRVTGFSS